MNVNFVCSKCHGHARQSVDESSAKVDCDHCGQVVDIPEGAVAGDKISRCIVCPSTDLYVRKDFPQHLGVLLVVIGLLGSTIAWGYGQIFWTFGILFATALLDLLLYMFVGEALMCYRCNAIYRGAANQDTHGPFQLETHEKYRQLQARADELKAISNQNGNEVGASQ